MEKTSANHRQLTGILFPGVVNDEKKAIHCLGGIRSISRVYTQQTQTRLGLSFQRDNPYIKKVFANTKPTAGVAISVRVKKRRDENNVVKREIVSTKILGTVHTMFKFESMCDFQFLPIQKEGAGFKCVVEDILPSGIETTEFLKGPAPLMVLPATFSRAEKPSNYCYTDKRYPNERLKQFTGENDEFHHKLRSDRMVPGVRFDFNLTDEYPTKPLDEFLKKKDERIEVNPQVGHEEYETVTKLFEKRPIWTANLIRYETKIRVAVLKIYLPCLAYYMKTGPWRSTWIKYGYDPRKDPEARIYQCLDFRLRFVAGVHSMVSSRIQFTKYKRADRVKLTKPSAKQGNKTPAAEQVAEGAVYLRPGLAPAQRQIFYLYCDIHLPEVQELINTPPLPGYLCHLTRGWLPPNTAEKCRDIIFKHVQDTLLNLSNSEINFEGESSEEDSDDDNDTSATATELDETSNT